MGMHARTTADPGTGIGLLRSRDTERNRHLNAQTLTGDPAWIAEFRRLLTANEESTHNMRRLS